MRAVLIRDGKGPINNLYIGNAHKPSPGPEQVLVKESHPEFLLLNRFHSFSLHCSLRPSVSIAWI
jgi:hypothetical protein